jgi:DNA-binding beta-propeller fold protein YncE
MVSPVNVLMDPAGKYLYEADSLHGIRAFRVQADNTLTQNGPDFNDINTQYGAAAIAPDGKTLYASGVSGPQFTPSIRIDHINSDGTLTNMGSVADNAFGMRVAPSGAFLIVFNDAGITTYLIGATGTLTKGASVSSSLSAPIQTAITPNGKNLYLAASVANSNSKSIEQFAVHADGSLTALSPAVVSVGNNPFDIVVTPDGKFLYVVNSADSTLSQFKINADGTLTPLSPPTVPG